MTGPLNDQDRADLLTLVRLEGMGPSRLRWLVGEASDDGEVRTPGEVKAALAAGRLPDGDRRRPRGLTARVVDGWFQQIRQVEGSELLDEHRRLGIEVLAPHDPDWPFTSDPEPPALLFAAGDTAALHHPLKAAVVGTRRCTSVGRRVAQGFGADLTAAGVSVVSGLALGIDGSAHQGALSRLVGGRPSGRAGPDSVDGTAKPIGVVAGGIDHVYPPNHADLWQQVMARGVLVSEAPLGVPPARWRFPARNRLIAGLADVVVVVESHRQGGSLLTADEAADRGVPVLAVPGSVLSASSAGTNALLLDGCGPVRSASDVTELLGLSQPVPVSAVSSSVPFDEARSASPSKDGRPAEQLPLGLGADLLREVAGGPVHVDTLVAATGRPLTEVLTITRQLSIDGQVVLDGNWVGPTSGGDR